MLRKFHVEQIKAFMLWANSPKMAILEKIRYEFPQTI